MKNGYIKKTPSGKYLLTVTVGSDYRGKKKRYYRTVAAKNDKEAEREMAIFLAECLKQKVSAANSMKFKEFVEIWKTQYGEVHLKKSTLVTHLRNLKMNFGMFNEKSISKIKTIHVNQWITYLYKERKLSPKTIRNNYSLLHSILQKAVIWEYIDRNPADNVELPKRQPKEALHYDEENLMKLLKALKEVPLEQQNYKVGILIGLFGGLRRGEICGLDVSDVDLKRNTITVRQTRMVYGNGGLYIDTPKTLQSVRTITLPIHIMEEISRLLDYHRGQKIILEDIWQDSPALLKNEVGNPIYPQSLLRWFYKLQKEHKLEHLSIHGLRHTHTSMLTALGQDITEVSRRLGHSQKSTTLNIYSHLFLKNDDKIADTLDSKYLKDDN